MRTYRVYFLSAQSIIAAEMIDAVSPTEAATVGTRMVSSSPWRDLGPDRLEVWQGAKFYHTGPVVA
jgi:hypothetical protein